VKLGAQFVLLPGMGADEGMYPAPWTSLPGAQFLSWPTWRGERTLDALADRLARDFAFPTDVWLVGSSLGGMVACELAGRINARGLILVGSAIHPREINFLLTSLAPLARVPPLQLLQGAARVLPSELTKMFGKADPSFLQAMCVAVTTWKGAQTLPNAHLRIHGAHDLVIPPPQTKHVSIAGGHLIAMTHPAECVAAVTEFVTAQLKSRNDPNSGSNSRR
jgi:pimeloyl-ACP methyl ester carboxylesterase